MSGLSLPEFTEAPRTFKAGDTVFRVYVSGWSDPVVESSAIKCVNKTTGVITLKERQAAWRYRLMVNASEVAATAAEAWTKRADEFAAQARQFREQADALDKTAADLRSRSEVPHV